MFLLWSEFEPLNYKFSQATREYRYLSSKVFTSWILTLNVFVTITGILYFEKNVLSQEYPCPSVCWPKSWSQILFYFKVKPRGVSAPVFLLSAANVIVSVLWGNYSAELVYVLFQHQQLYLWRINVSLESKVISIFGVWGEYRIERCIKKRPDSCFSVLSGPYSDSH